MSDPGLFPGVAVCALLALTGALLLLVTGSRHGDAGFQVRLFLLALALRFALSVAVYQFGLVRVLGDEDASGWLGGVGLMQQWRGRHLSVFELPFALTAAFEEHHRGYKYMLGAFFFVTDSPFRLVAAALNGFYGAMTVALAYRVARSLFPAAVAMRVGWWTCFFPSMLIWSALTVKEPVVIFLETVALYCCIRLRQRGFSLPHLAVCALTVLLLVPFRFYAGYIVAAAVLLSLVAPSLRQPKSGVAGALLAVAVVGLLAASGVHARNAAVFEHFDMEYVQRFRTAVATGPGAGSGVEQDFDMRTRDGFVKGTLNGAAHLLLAPFPWQLGGASLRMLLTLPELLAWWYLFFAGVVPGLRHCLRHRLIDVSPLLLMIAGFGLLYSMMFGNVGLVFRQRAQLLPWLLVFAAVGIELRRRGQLLTHRPTDDDARSGRVVLVGSREVAPPIVRTTQ